MDKKALEARLRALEVAARRVTGLVGNQHVVAHSQKGLEALNRLASALDGPTKGEEAREKCCGDAACFNESSGVPCAVDPKAPAPGVVEAAFRTGYDNGYGDAATEGCDGFDVPGVEKHLEAYLETLPPSAALQATPQEKPKVGEYPHSVDDCMRYMDFLAIEGIAGGSNPRIGGMALSIAQHLDRLKKLEAKGEPQEVPTAPEKCGRCNGKGFYFGYFDRAADNPITCHCVEAGAAPRDGG